MSCSYLVRCLYYVLQLAREVPTLCPAAIAHEVPVLRPAAI